MVDVLVTGQAVAAQTVQLNITRTILENVRVLAAGQKIEQDRDGKPQTVSVITVLVSPERRRQAGDGQHRKERFSWRCGIPSTQKRPIRRRFCKLLFSAGGGQGRLPSRWSWPLRRAK